MAKDPFRYFRVEARELLDGLTQGIMDIEKGPVHKDLLARLLRLAHTLKGAARVVNQREVSELAHAIEDVLAPHRDAAAPIPGDRIRQLFKLVDDCGERLRPVLATPGAEAAPAPTQVAPEPLTSFRIDIVEMDSILYDLASAGVQLRTMRDEAASLQQIAESLGMRAAEPASQGTDLRGQAEEAHTRLRQCQTTLAAGLERMHRDLDGIRDRASALRLVPAQTIFPVLERAARDAAESLRKRVAFEASGGDQRLDAHVLLGLRDALAHLVRNAVGHGIEVGPARAAASKPAVGSVRLQVSKHGQHVHFIVEDDGRGIDLAAIRRVVVARGLVSHAEAETLDMARAAQLLLQGGVSTAPEVSEVMGRGIGLDIVRAAAVRLKGDVHLRSEAGCGAAVEIIVPVSLDSMDALAVLVGGRTLLLPRISIRQALRVQSRELARSAHGVTLLLDGEALPFAPLADILSSAPRRDAWPHVWTAIVLHARGMHAAIGVDRLDGVQNVVVRPLPNWTGPVPLIAGATLDGQGNPLLVLDAGTLVTAVRSGAHRAVEPAAPQQQPVLVVDDSLTTRMLEQSILEAAGYRVDLAVSAEEGLEKARANCYAAFIVDVEMPGMSGFDLLERFQADPALRSVPAILVTSRAAAEDRERGARVGARAYIVKSEFEEGRLLRIIRDLIGKGTA